MADTIVVEGKPTELPPADMSVIPPAVRKRAAAVDDYYRQQAASGDGVPPASSEEAPGSATQTPDVPVPASPQAQPAPAASPGPREGGDENTQRARALSQQGRQTNKELTAERDALRARLAEREREFGEFQEQIFRERMQTPRVVDNAAPPAPQAPAYLTSDDETNYGRDLLDVAQRAAQQVVAPYILRNEARLEQLVRENADLRARQERERKRVLDSQLEALVPDYRDFDANPRWHKWLSALDPRSGSVRQLGLNKAISAGSAPRVALFFDDFRREEIATGHVPDPSAPSPAPKPPREAALNLNALASPGRARTGSSGSDATASSDKPVYTPQRIAELYRQHQRGAYLGREADWARVEADIFAAQSEGRVVRP